MTFSEILPFLLAGKKVYCRSWGKTAPGFHLLMRGSEVVSAIWPLQLPKWCEYQLGRMEFEATDWEILDTTPDTCDNGS